MYQKAYLTKRRLLSSSGRAIRIAAADAMAIEGFLIIAEGGWVVKKYADGKIEKLNKLEPIKQKVVLD